LEFRNQQSASWPAAASPLLCDVLLTRGEGRDNINYPSHNSAHTHTVYFRARSLLQRFSNACAASGRRATSLILFLQTANFLLSVYDLALLRGKKSVSTRHAPLIISLIAFLNLFSSMANVNTCQFNQLVSCRENRLCAGRV
jgi:hypothetical protein